MKSHGEYLLGELIFLCFNKSPYFELFPTESVDFTVLENARPSWLYGLELDYFIPDYNIAFEYQGEQHYTPNFEWGGTNEYIRRIFYDIQKDYICKKNGIVLVKCVADTLENIPRLQHLILLSLCNHYRIPIIKIIGNKEKVLLNTTKECLCLGSYYSEEHKLIHKMMSLRKSILYKLDDNYSPDIELKVLQKDFYKKSLEYRLSLKNKGLNYMSQRHYKNSQEFRNIFIKIKDMLRTKQVRMSLESYLKIDIGIDELVDFAISKTW